MIRWAFVFLFVLFLLGVTRSYSQQFHNYDKHLVYSESERKFELIGLSVDSIFQDSMNYTFKLYSTRLIFYLNGNERIEIATLHASQVTYRQFYDQMEIAFGNLILDSSRFEIERNDLSSNSEKLESRSLAYYARDKDWKSFSLLKGLWVEEKQFYNRGVKQGRFETTYHGQVLKTATYESGKLVSEVLHYKEQMNSRDFLGEWQLLNRESYAGNSENQNKSVFVFSINGQSLNKSMFLREDGTYTYFSYSPVIGIWDFFEESKSISFTTFKRDFEILFLLEGHVIVVESDK